MKPFFTKASVKSSVPALFSSCVRTPPTGQLSPAEQAMQRSLSLTKSKSLIVPPASAHHLLPKTGADGGNSKHWPIGLSWFVISNKNKLFKFHQSASPAGQILHSREETAAGDLVVVGALQAMHAICPGESWYMPTEHGSHAEELAFG